MDFSIWNNSKKLLCLIFPRFCVICLKEMQEEELFEMVCGTCFLSINQVIPETWPHQHFYRAVYYGSYEHPILHSIIYHFKYRGIKSLAHPLGEYMARALEDAGIEQLCARQKPVISFIPLSPVKERWRGYNQSQLLAHYIGNYFSLPVIPLLARRHLTPPQASLERKQDRAENIRDAFTPLVSAMPSHILLVDDVITSGATLDAAAQVLREYGASIVWAVTAAGVERHHQGN